jgi:CBS domain-containing protein
MVTAGQVLQQKGNRIWSVSPAAMVYDALALMAENNLGAVLVMEDAAIVGIFSERDYARKVILKGKSSRETPVREIMTEEVLFVGPNQSIPDCMSLMTEKRVRHLPVMDDAKLIGVISIGDVVKAIIAEHEFVIKQLENYISGNP